MKKIQCIFFLLLFTGIISSAQENPFNKGEKYYLSTEINDTLLKGNVITVYGYIAQVVDRDLEELIYLNFDNQYPQNTCSLRINKKTYEGNLDELFHLEHKKIYARGKMGWDYKKKDGINKPTIFINSPSQIKAIKEK